MLCNDLNGVWADLSIYLSLHKIQADVSGAWWDRSSAGAGVATALSSSALRLQSPPCAPHPCLPLPCLMCCRWQCQISAPVQRTHMWRIQNNAGHFQNSSLILWGRDRGLEQVLCSDSPHARPPEQSLLIGSLAKTSILFPSASTVKIAQRCL